MSTKTITIMEEAYRVLRKEKHGGESFSQVILRKFENKPRGSLMECFGTWKISKEEWERAKVGLHSQWRAYEKRLKKREVS